MNKEEVEKMYIQALIDDLPPNVFADQVLRLVNVSGSLPNADFVCGKCKAWGCNSLMGLFEHREQCVGGNDR